MIETQARHHTMPISIIAQSNPYLSRRYYNNIQEIFTTIAKIVSINSP